MRITLQRLAQHPDPTFTAEMRPEGYTIASTPSTLTLTGATAAGLFYAAQTVKQLIEQSPNGPILHAADIHDWPAMKYRGLHDDLSRGPVDTLDHASRLPNYGSKMGIDATRKWPAEGFHRPWPSILTMPEEIKSKVDALCKSLGF